MASRSELARRVAAVERAKAETAPSGGPVAYWPDWGTLLSAAEQQLLRRLEMMVRRQPWPGEGDWQAGYRGMCETDAERAMLEGIFAKEQAAERAPRAARPARHFSVALPEWLALLRFPDDELAAVE
jgi:hypothetical protein